MTGGEGGKGPGTKGSGDRGKGREQGVEKSKVGEEGNGKGASIRLRTK